MNIFYYICQEYIKEEKWNFGMLVLLGILLSIFYTNLSSFATANIINNVKNGASNSGIVDYYYLLFIGTSIVFLILFYAYKYFQNVVLTKVFFWIKHIILKVILKVNNLNMSNINFIDFIVPITRIASSAHSLLNRISGDVIPTLCFLLAISGYFLYKNIVLGITFFLANIIIIVYFFYFGNEMFTFKRKQESSVVSTETYMIDLLNNFDKVIYKGQSDNEIQIFQTKTDKIIEISTGIENYILNHCFVMNCFIYLIIFGTIWYLIRLQRNKKIDVTTFITFFTIIIMYRDNLSDTIHGIPTIMEHFSRIENIGTKFNNMVGTDHWEMTLNQIFEEPSIKFDKMKFEKVDFKYSGTDKYVLKDFNLELSTNNKIIGITGLSGRGKTTFMKLLLRIYPCTNGIIAIDGVNINKIDPNFIRSNITFVNQNSRLFDRVVIDNILYGCQDIEKCNDGLKEILKYPKIKELYKNIDINTNMSGPLGENLSGGQRQIANIISGLINPSKILILDEPTNALDPELKRELLLILQHFKKYKKCIIIITHDKEVYSLFDETVKM